MSRKTDNPPKILPPEWPRLADNPSKIGPPNWLPLEEAFQRMRDLLASSGLAKDDLYDLLRSGEWPSAVRRVNANGEETCRLVPAEFWRIEAGLSVEIDANGADHIAVHYLDYSLSDGRMDFFVRAADIEREERLYPTTAAPPPAPGKEAKRTLRRRHSKYPWHEICGEIARLCIDPKTRRVRVPKNESELAEKVLQFCQNTLECEPPVSDMREAVAAICAALRNI